MGQAETRDLQAGRPLSPHLQVWRWHVTMATSILNRATGVALYVGAVGLAVWLFALAAGPQAFGTAQGLLATIPGQLVLFGITFSLVYHLVNGIRHLVWDAGFGLTPGAANVSSWFVLIVSFLAPVAIFALAALSGARP